MGALPPGRRFCLEGWSVDMRAPDLIGQIFGRLTVTRRAGYRGQRALWECSCECGAAHFATTSDLRYGSIRSCGCLLAGKTASNSRHGQAARSGPSSSYNSWRGMVERCTNPNHVSFSRYGGRGIEVCERWRTFANFAADMGPRPDGCSIDRINPDGNYEPTNCRWATALVQRHNRSVKRQIDEVAA